MKIYGPYTRKDGRKHIIKYDGKTRKTQSYPRYLMEQHLGRELLPTEEVDHDDNDFTNDNLANLVLLTGIENRQKEMKRPHRIAKIGSFICSECNTFFNKSMRNVKHNNISKGKAGPFCSRSCAGKYSARIQWA